MSRSKKDDLVQPIRSAYRFQVPDLALAKLWLTLTEKEAEQAKKHLLLLGLEGVQVALILHHVAEARKQLGKATDPDTGTIEGDVRLSSGEVYVLRIGGALHAGELEKAAEKQEKLGVIPDDTRAKMAQVADLSDRLEGQVTLEFAAEPIRESLRNIDPAELQERLQEEMRAAGLEDATVTVTRGR